MQRIRLTRAIVIAGLVVGCHLCAELPGEAKTSQQKLRTARGIRSKAVLRPSPRPRAAPAVGARAVLLKDLDSGRILHTVEPDRRLPPASLTKMMTALIALERGRLDDVVQISSYAASAPRTRLDLAPGQRLTLLDLIQAMLITSANDACRAVAEHVGGSEEQFVAVMNTKAAALRLENTHFRNACGFDHPWHYSTASDLARLSEIALKHPLFQSIVKRDVAVIRALDHGEIFVLHSTNRLFGVLAGVEGIKTGYTSHAGPCLTAKVSQQGRQLLIVLLHARPRWQMAAQLLQEGFAQLENAPGSVAETPPGLSLLASGRSR